MNTYVEDRFVAQPGCGRTWDVLQQGAEHWTLTGVSQEQAEYAAMLMNHGVDRDDMEEAVMCAECVRCEATVMGGQMDEEGRCPACQP